MYSNREIQTQKRDLPHVATVAKAMRRRRVSMAIRMSRAALPEGRTETGVV